MTAFLGILKGEAATWADTIEAGNYRQLKQEFLEKYWNERIQKRIVHHILDGRYEPDIDGSREAYFRRWATLARSLDQFREDEWIIERMKNHFNERIRDKIEMREPRTINETAQLLMRFDKPDFGLGSIRRETEKRFESKAPGRTNINPQNRNKDDANKIWGETPRNRSDVRRRDTWKGRNGDKRGNPQLRAIQEDESSYTSSATEEDWEDDTYPSEEEPGLELPSEEIGLSTLIAESDSEDDADEELCGQKRRKCPEILVEIGKKRVKALLDTGAQISAVSEGLLKTWETEGQRLRELPAPSTTVKGALGEKLKINRQVLVEVRIGREEILQACLVVKKLSNPIILGFDFIHDNEVIIDPTQGTVFLGNMV